MLSRSEDLALLVGRLFVAALFLPSGIHKLMTFWSFAASLGAKGVPYANGIAILMVAAEVLGPVALILGAWPRWTALVLVTLTVASVWTTYRTGIAGALFRPRQNLEFYRTVAIMGGLLFYFASGPGAWSWPGGTGRRT